MPLQDILAAIDTQYNRLISDATERVQRAKSAGDLKNLQDTLAGIEAYGRQSAQLKELATSGALPETGVSPDLIGQFIEGQPTAIQGLNELVAAQKQLSVQNQQLQQFRTQAETQIFGGPGATLEQALTGTGELGQLSRALQQQQSEVFQRELRPLVEQQLAPAGLLDSGANIELQAKALGGLERSRQQQLLEAALGARQGIRGLERTDILGSIGAQQQALTNLADIQRAGVTMQFQAALERERANLLRELSSRPGGGGLARGLFGALGGAMAGGAAGGPYGALAGALGGGFLGAFGGQEATSGIAGGTSVGSFLGAFPSSIFRTQPTPTTG